MTIGEKIRWKRNQFNLSQERLAQLLKVNLKTIYRWEHDEAVPRPDTLKKLAEIFNESVEWFIHDEWCVRECTEKYGTDIDREIFKIPPDILEAVKNPKMQEIVRALRPIIERDGDS